MFTDKVDIEVRAGKGGDGLTSFSHDRLKAKAGPDGGDGGRGGDVIFVTDHNLNTLAGFRKNRIVEAESGKPGGRSRRHGKSAQEAVIKVPIGTAVYEGHDLVADLDAKDMQAVVARGGRGGFGNAHFVSSTRQTPRASELGEPGESKRVTLELKLVADVGLIGLPNAGKSTFLAAVSNAKPEIADYPFTTLVPNLGMVDFDGHSLLLADIPGLIEGASQGKGLGDDFLRHIERTHVVLHLVDANQENPAQAYATIQQELAAYKVDLTAKPQLVALTKVETVEKEVLGARLKKLEKAAGGSVWPVSAVAKQGVLDLLRQTWKMVEEVRLLPVEESELPVISLKTQPVPWTVEAADSAWVVRGTKIERFAIQTDFENLDALARLRDILSKQGIIKELERQGASAGSIIQIGEKRLEL